MSPDMNNIAAHILASARICSLILLCLATGGCRPLIDFGDDYELDSTTFTTNAIAAIENVSGLLLEDGVVGLHMAYFGEGIDDALIAKLRIPDDLASNVINQVKSYDHNPGVASESLADGYAWWNTNTMTVIVDRQVDREMNYLQIIVGKELDNFILLVKWFEL